MASKLKVTALNVTPTIIRASVIPNDNVYVAGGVQLNLSPGSILDPSALGVMGPSNVPSVLPAPISESLGGYYAQVVPATASGPAGLATYKLQYFQPGGAEIAAGAYPGAILAGTLVLEISYSL
jgi:hypothetical protein